MESYDNKIWYKNTVSKLQIESMEECVQELESVTVIETGQLSIVQQLRLETFLREL